MFSELADDYYEFKNKIMGWKAQVDDNLSDIARQTNKDSLVFSGQAIPKPQKGESVTEIACKLVLQKFGVQVKTHEVKFYLQFQNTEVQN